MNDIIDYFEKESLVCKPLSLFMKYINTDHIYILLVY